MPKYKVYIKDMAVLNIEADSYTLEAEVVIFYADGKTYSRGREQSQHIRLMVNRADLQGVELIGDE